jgi:hypothetical protein
MEGSGVRQVRGGVRSHEVLLFVKIGHMPQGMAGRYSDGEPLTQAGGDGFLVAGPGVTHG